MQSNSTSFPDRSKSANKQSDGGYRPELLGFLHRMRFSGSAGRDQHLSALQQNLLIPDAARGVVLILP